jgi:hypothetical protein
MPARSSDPRRPRLASGPQRWHVNTLGRLRLVDCAPPISSSEAKATIGAELDKLRLTRFPRTGETTVGQRWRDRARLQSGPGVHGPRG